MGKSAGSVGLQPAPSTRDVGQSRQYEELSTGYKPVLPFTLFINTK